MREGDIFKRRDSIKRVSDVGKGGAELGMGKGIAELVTRGRGSRVCDGGKGVESK